MEIIHVKHFVYPNQWYETICKPLSKLYHLPIPEVIFKTSCNILDVVMRRRFPPSEWQVELASTQKSCVLDNFIHVSVESKLIYPISSHVNVAVIKTKKTNLNIYCLRNKHVAHNLIYFIIVKCSSRYS